MPIKFEKYVDVTSGVGGAAQVENRELIGRLFTSNALVPTDSYLEATDLKSVGDYFGFDSEEYKRASFYFGWVSKLITSPQKISFARWTNADSAPQIFGEVSDYVLSDFTSIADGAITLTLGPDTEIITGLDFTTDLSLADVAATIQAGIQAANVAVLWTGATVTYNATRKSFDFVGGATGDAVISVANAGSGTEIAALIGWLNTGTILSDGNATETITEVLTNSDAVSNNFGSFLFMPALTQEEVVEAAEWSKAQNVKYQFYHAILEVDAQAYYDDLKDIGATGIMIKGASIVDEYPEMMPMNILAATDYSRRNVNQNYMFQQFNITATVTETANSDNLDDLRMNYYGQTQQAGAGLSFFQRGVLMGLSSDPLDMNTFANEQWLKDDAAVNIMNLLLAVTAVSATDTGTAQVLTSIQPTIDQAKFNGTIVEGKELDNTQQAFITAVTGDEDAWRQVENIGYWVEAKVEDDGQGGNKITYLLIYAKGDAIRKVEGTHTLI